MPVSGSHSYYATHHISRPTGWPIRIWKIRFCYKKSSSIFESLVFVVYLDPASGGSIDWVRGVLDTPYTYVWELRDTGLHGFLLPASQIIDTAEETFNSAAVILQHAKRSLRGSKKQWSPRHRKAISTTDEMNTDSYTKGHINVSRFQLYDK